MKNNSTNMQDSILIQVPIDVVFNYITDFENTPHWHKNMKKVGKYDNHLMNWPSPWW